MQPQCQNVLKFTFLVPHLGQKHVLGGGFTPCRGSEFGTRSRSTAILKSDFLPHLGQKHVLERGFTPMSTLDVTHLQPQFRNVLKFTFVLHLGQYTRADTQSSVHAAVVLSYTKMYLSYLILLKNACTGMILRSICKKINHEASLSQAPPNYQKNSRQSSNVLPSGKKESVIMSCQEKSRQWYTERQK